MEGLGIRIGVLVAMNHFPSFDPVQADQPGVTDHSADSSPLQFGAFIQSVILRHICGRLQGRYGRQSFRQVYQNGEVTGTVKALFLDATLLYRQPVGKIDLLAGAGVTWAHDEIADWYDGRFEQGLPNRSQSGFKTNFAAAVEFPLAGRVRGGVGSYLVTGFAKNDADKHLGFSAHLGWGF